MAITRGVIPLSGRIGDHLCFLENESSFPLSKIIEDEKISDG